MKVLLQSEFVQFNLLSADDFLRFLNERGINIRLKELEYYDEKNIIRPILRIHRTKIDQPYQKYNALLTDSITIKGYYQQGLTEFPRDDDFQPWKSHLDGYEKSVVLFYHPYQFVSVRHLTMGFNMAISAQALEDLHIDKLQEFLQQRKDRLANIIQISQNAAKKWSYKIGLLMLLQEAYGYYIGTLLRTSENRQEFYERWWEWKINRFQPAHILKNSGMNIEQVKEWYGDLARLGYRIDPLSRWYPLLQLINGSKKERLKKEALLAQEYYKLAKMVTFFIYDLTKEKMHDPDDLMDGNMGKWKQEIYGNQFDYVNKQTQTAILDNYLIDRPYRIALIYEGPSEDVIIKKMFEILNVDEERDGIFLYPADGQGNIQNNTYSLAELAKANEMDIFLILDHDANWQNIIKDFLQRGYLKNDMYHVWEKDFEYDNFGADIVVDKVNYFLEKRQLFKIETDKVKDKISNSNIVLMKAISDLIWRNNQINMNKVISKKELAEVLFEPRIAKIKEERNSDSGWKPLLPIEEILKKVFNLIPRISG